MKEKITNRNYKQKRDKKNDSESLPSSLLFSSPIKEKKKKQKIEKKNEK